MSTRNVLVTGVNGFVGPYLATELKSRGNHVTGVGFEPEPAKRAQSHIDDYVHADLTNQEQVASINFKDIDIVIHLAGWVAPAMSINQPQKFIGDNSAMLINLFQESLKQRTDSQPRFVIVSSGTVYDNTQPMPLKETSKLTYNNPYSISKILNENLCKYYETRGFDTIVVRPFNHTGPGQMGGFLIPDLTEQVLKAGPDGIISAGNLETRRDYSDVRDIVKGYVSIALADQLEPKLFNLCSGKSMSGKEMLDLIVKAVLGETGKVTVEVDQSKIRPNDLQEIYGDNSLAKQSFGWKPTISIDKTIADYVEWRRSTDK